MRSEAGRLFSAPPCHTTTSRWTSTCSRPSTRAQGPRAAMAAALQHDPARRQPADPPLRQQRARPVDHRGPGAEAAATDFIYKNTLYGEVIEDFRGRRRGACERRTRGCRGRTRGTSCASRSPREAPVPLRLRPSDPTAHVTRRPVGGRPSFSPHPLVTCECPAWSACVVAMDQSCVFDHETIEHHGMGAGVIPRRSPRQRRAHVPPGARALLPQLEGLVPVVGLRGLPQGA